MNAGDERDDYWMFSTTVYRNRPWSDTGPVSLPTVVIRKVIGLAIVPLLVIGLIGVIVAATSGGSATTTSTSSGSSLGPRQWLPTGRADRS